MSAGYLVITLLVSILGIVGNSLVIGALLVHSRLRVLNNIFIGNLALADLFVAGIIHPFTALAILRGKDSFYHEKDSQITDLCKFLGSSCVISCTSSVFSIAAVALNRYVYICHHQRYSKIYTRNTVPVMVASIWVLGFFVDFPMFIGFGRHVYHIRASTCIFDTVHPGYKIYFILFGILLPITVITFSYTRIVSLVIKTSHRVQNRVESETSAPATRVKPADVKLLKTVAAIGILGVVIYTPLSLTLLLDHGQVSAKIWKFSTGLMHSYSCINWLVYAVTNNNFRRGYVLIFKKFICRPFFKGTDDLNESINTEMTTGAHR